MKKLAIITTHPIQYNAPLFRLLTERKKINVKVFYTWGQSKNEVYDAKFGFTRSWDIPLLDGYEHEFVQNTSKHPDSNRFFGVINPGLTQQLKNENFDALLIIRWNVYSHLLLLQTFGKTTKLFFRGDSHLLAKPKGIKGLFKKSILKLVYRKVDTAFFVGTHNKAYFLQNGLTDRQLQYAPQAIDDIRFTKNLELLKTKALNERTALNIPLNAVVFLYAGKFYALKQLDLLITSFQQLKGEQYRLLLVGNGEQEQYLKELAKTDVRILFQPFYNQSDMPWVYRMADVFVLPSKSETWGLGVNEAMVCGLPAIVSDQCGCAPELIVKGKTGFVFKTNNAADLLKQLESFTTKEKAAAMAPNVQAHIQQFSYEKAAEVIENAVLAASINL